METSSAGWLDLLYIFVLSQVRIHDLFFSKWMSFAYCPHLFLSFNSSSPQKFSFILYSSFFQGFEHQNGSYSQGVFFWGRYFVQVHEFYSEDSVYFVVYFPYKVRFNYIVGGSEKVIVIRLCGKIQNSMIETIIQIEGKKYPFVIDEGEPNWKIESLLMVDSGRVYEEKRRFQIIKNIANPSLITLNQIYQEQTILHLIYEYVPLSISSLLEKLLPELKEEYDHLYISKVILKNVAYELSVLTDFLASIKIKTTLDYENIGLVDNFQVGQWKIKYFLGSDFQFVEASRDDFGEYYAKERKNVLIQLEKSLEIQKKSSYLPNFIIKGSKLIFTDQLSETTQRKPKTQYCAEERFEQNHYRATDPNKNFGSGNSTRSKGKWGNKTKQKHHKNSENFQHNIFQQEKLNRSFDDESQNISVTQTKSMRIEIEQQQNNGRQRKNSYKFRITTFQEISIDQDEPGEQTYDENCRQASNMPQPQFIKESAKNIQTSNETSQKSESKNYKDKVNEAKAKAQTLLSQYFKSKANKKS